MIINDVEIRDLGRTGKIEPYDHERVQPASYDLSLGSQFKNMRTQGRIIPASQVWPRWSTYECDESDSGFPLEPGGFALGHTLETVRVPRHLVGQVNGKSSLGRVGLTVHATAGFVDPGFEGQVVLEFFNLSQSVIWLTPGMRIAQMVWIRLTAPASRPYGHAALGSHYQGQTGVQVPGETPASLP